MEKKTTFQSLRRFNLIIIAAPGTNDIYNRGLSNHIILFVDMNMT